MQPAAAARAACHLAVGDDVDVDVAGAVDGLGSDAGTGQHRSQPGAAAGAQHQLGGVFRAGERQQRFGDIVPDHLVVGAAQRFGQAPLRGERRRAGAGEPVGPDDVHGQQVAADRAGSDPGGAADQRLAFRASGQRDDHALAGFPGLPDAMLGPVLQQAFFHPVSHPQQGELAQGGEVTDTEVVGQRCVDLLGGIHVAVRHPPPQRLRRHVDDLDLPGGTDDGVRDGLPLRHAGDLLHDVVDRLQMLDVDRGDHGDPGRQQLVHVLPALGVPRTRDVGMREFVDERDLRLAREHRVEVHLLERAAAVGDDAAGNDPSSFSWAC